MLLLPFGAPADLPAARASVRMALANHGVVAIPTESSYGLAANPFDPKGVAAVFLAKGRSAEKALPLVAASLAQVELFAVVEPAWRRRLSSAWPAPLSIVLTTRSADMPGPTVAVRVPSHPLLCGLLHATGPLTATSANRSGEPPALAGDVVAAVFSASVALLLDGGVLAGGPPSTVVDASGPIPRLLRAGAFTVPPEWGVKAV